MKHVLTFKLERETKGALRYQEVEQNGRPVAVDSPADDRIIGTLYIRKAALNGQFPPNLTVTLEA